MKFPPLLKLVIVSAIVAGLGYVGLNVTPEQVEEAIDTQFSEPTVQPAPENGVHQVVTVIDGDTFIAERDGNEVTVRAIGIDTPETEYSERGEECYGAEATEEARRLLTGTSVQLQPDPTQDTFDAYGRLLAYATMEDGRDFGEVMIGGGFAEEFTYRNAYNNQQSYQNAETLARNKQVGLWSCE